MHLHCWYCKKDVTSELPKKTIFRGIAICPECAYKENQSMIQLRTENNVALEIKNVGDLPFALHVHGTIIRLTDEMAADIRRMLETGEQIRDAADQFNKVNNPPIDVPF